MSKKWLFLYNPFITGTVNNFKKAYEIARYTDAALHARVADPFFAALYAVYHPLFVAFETEHNDWLSQGGIQKGATASLDQLLSLLGNNDEAHGITSKINEWKVAVEAVFPKISPTYKAIFPHGSKPFQRSDKDMRIAAVAALSTTLADYPALAALKITVDAFLTLLNDARTEQQGKISNTATDSDEVRAAQQAAMTGMFSLYGSLIAHYAAAPDDVEAFFDLETLRDLPQTKWISSISSSQTKNLFKRTLENLRKIKITNLAARELTFFVASEKNDRTEGGGVSVPGLEDQVFDWGTLKQHEDSSYFNIANGTTDVDGHFKIEILPEGDDD